MDPSFVNDDIDTTFGTDGTHTNHSYLGCISNHTHALYTIQPK